MTNVRVSEMDKYTANTDPYECIRKWCKKLYGKYIEHADRFYFDRICIVVYHAFYQYMNVFVILHNIRSAHNVGSIFRTGDGAGVSKIYLTGYTPAPIDRFGRPHPEILKTSLGAVQTVPYEVIPDVQQLIANLKKEGVCIVAVEQTKKAHNYKQCSLERDTAFIFGNEITGIEEELLNSVDEQILVPMYGAKESLNVSVCAGIILFHFR